MALKVGTSSRKVSNVFAQNLEDSNLHKKEEMHEEVDYHKVNNLTISFSAKKTHPLKRSVEPVEKVLKA